MKPYIGLMVHWVVPCGKYKGEHVPAVIVRIRSEQRCDLHVLTGFNNFRRMDMYMPSIHDESKNHLGSWHYIEEEIGSLEERVSELERSITGEGV